MARAGRLKSRGDEMFTRLSAAKQAVILLGFGAVVLVLILTWSYNRAHQSVSQDSASAANQIQLNISRALDSPLGFIPDADKTDHGMVALTLKGIGAAPKIEKTVAYYIQSDGSVLYDMLPDDNTVSRTLDYLAAKSTTMTDDKAIYHASRFMKLDFSGLFNFESLQSQYPDMFSGLLAAYENNTTVSGANGRLRPNRDGAGCQASAAKLRPLVSDAQLNTQRLPTNGAVHAINQRGEPELRFTVAPTYFTDIDAALSDFITQCYLESAPESERSYLLALLAAYTKHPTYTFTITVAANNVKSVTMTSQFAPDANGIVQTGPEVTITVLPDKAPDFKEAVSARSLLDRPNVYALTYAYCRVPPLVGRANTAGKIVVSAIQSASYVSPSSYDSVYACVKNDARLKDYTLISNDIWAIKGRNTRVSDAAVAASLKLHDIAAAIEQSFVQQKSYPTIEAMQAGRIQDLPMQDLLDGNDKLINTGDLNYSVSPENCSECINYTLTYKTAQDGVLTFTDYARQADSW